MNRIGCIALVLLAGMSLGRAAEPGPAQLAAAKDARSVLVVIDEHSRVAVPQAAPGSLSIHQLGSLILGQRTQGMLRVVNEGDTLDLLEAARVPFETARDPAYIRVRRAHLARATAAAAAQGIDYLAVIHDWNTRSEPYTHTKNDRLKLLGAAGISYQVETKGILTERELELSIWHCKSGRLLFTQRFQATDGGGTNEKRDLDEWLGLAVVQRLMPESTQTERNPQRGDYAFATQVDATLRMSRRNPPVSGTLGHSFMVPVTRVARRGEEVLITVRVENVFDDPLRLDFRGSSDVFCLDKNGLRYDAIRQEGPSSGTIASGATRETTWVFRIPDRNTDFVNLHLQVAADLPPDFFARSDLQWTNIQLYPLGSPSPSPPVARPAKIAVSDGSAWQMRDSEGRIYTAKTALGRPVVVFYCGHDILEKTGMFSEGSTMGLAASRVGRLNAKLRDRGILFLWVDDSSDPNGAKDRQKAAKKFKLTMPVVSVDEYYKWHIATRGQPWLAVLDGEGNLAKLITGATAISEFDGTLIEQLPAPPAVSEPAAAGSSGSVRPSRGDFGEDALLAQVSGDAELGSFESIEATFSGDQARIWAALCRQAKVWRSDPQRGWIHGKGYIHQGAWSLLSPSRNCRHVISLQGTGNSWRVHVVTILWKHTVTVRENKQGGMDTLHSETADYDRPTSVRLSQKFLEEVKKRLK